MILCWNQNKFVAFVYSCALGLCSDVLSLKYDEYVFGCSIIVGKSVAASYSASSRRCEQN